MNPEKIQLAVHTADKVVDVADRAVDVIGKGIKVAKPLDAALNAEALLIEKTGKRMSLKNFGLSFVNLRSLPTCKKQVKALLNIIIPRKPTMENRGTIKRNGIILKNESKRAVLKVKDCWSSPFKMPSEILSRYISGTMGERYLIKLPEISS